MARALILVLSGLILSACTETPTRDIGSSSRQIADDARQKSADEMLLSDLSAEAAAELANTPTPQSGRSYSLAQLIDIAQRRNPATKQAWLIAREAGRESGVIGSALEPVVALSALAGRQSFDASQRLPIIGTQPIPTDTDGSAVVLTVNWLLFDFGENAARQRAASSLARVSELGFNRVHQQLIFDVAIAYHARIAALSKLRVAQQASARAGQLVNAADRRLAAGVGTQVEVAQARQLAAQTRVIERNAEGEARAGAVNLAALLALPPDTRIQLQAPAGRLPRADDAQLSALIERAFLNRSDVLAALSQVNAAEADLDAVAASYLPKIYTGAYGSVGDGAVDINGVVPLGLNTSGSSGVFVGATVPIYTGRAREGRLQGARDRIAQSRAGVQVAMLTASREIAVSYEILRTALAVRSAALELVSAAKTTNDAASKAYDAGIGTLSDASAAALGQFAAEEALADATRDARQAAAALALATGQ